MAKAKSPNRRRSAFRAAAGAVGAAALITLAAAPSAVGEEPVPELVVGDTEPIDGLQPGSSFDVPVTVGNKGPGTAGKVWVSYSVTRGLDYAEMPSNCRVQHIPPYDEMLERWVAVCAFDQAVEPGAVYTPEKPLRIKALDRALNDELRVRVGAFDPGSDENGSTPVQGTAPAVKLVGGGAGEPGSAPFVDVPVTSVNTADYRVTGAALKAAVGDTVSMTVKFTNAGPAWILTREGDRLVTVVVTPPAGTSVVKPGWFCHAEGRTYVCGVPSVNEGSETSYTFDLRIDKQVANARGSVALSTEPRPFDPDKSNDRADITLDVMGGAPAPTGGSNGGSPSSPASSSAGGSSATGNDTMATNGGTLAESGSSALPLAGTAVAALAAGALLVVRRRGAHGGH